jgi:hypothetical protein
LGAVSVILALSNAFRLVSQNGKVELVGERIIASLKVP